VVLSRGAPERSKWRLGLREYTCHVVDTDLVIDHEAFRAGRTLLDCISMKTTQNMSLATYQTVSAVPTMAISLGSI
jgi:hypothetical protein